MIDGRVGFWVARAVPRKQGDGRCSVQGWDIDANFDVEFEFVKVRV